MWVFAQHGFFSIVEDMDDQNTLVVRARVEGDLERYFPDAEVIESGGSDYRFRAHIPRKEVIIVVARMVYDVNYGNYKSSLSDHRRSPWYLRVWETMFNLQEALT